MRWRLAVLALAAAPAAAFSQDLHPASRPADDALREALGRARRAYAAEDFPAAERALRDALAASPDKAEVHLMLGAFHLRLRRYEDAAAAFERGLLLDPGEARDCPWVGHAYHELGKLEKAEAWYRKVLAANPGQVEAKRGLALTLFKTGREPEAEVLYRELREAAPADSEAAFDAHHRLGEILLARGETDAAIASLLEAERIDRFAPEVAYALARAYALSGEDAKAAEKRKRHALLNEARARIEALKARLRLAPRDAAAHFEVAGHFAAIGDDREAERALRRAAAIAPREARYALALVDFFEQRGRFDEALAALEQAARVLPREPAVYERAFRFHRDRGDFRRMYEAAEIYQDLTGRPPG